MINYLKRYWKIILCIFATGVVFLINYVYFESKDIEVEKKKDKKAIKIEAINSPKKEGLDKPETVFVDVKGAVNSPGVYELDKGKRIIDAINLAGGLKDKADTINLNLSKKLVDEMFIVIYTKDEIYNFKKKSNSATNEIKCASVECDCPDIKNDACIKKEEPKKAVSNQKFSLNSVTKDNLLSLDGIGEAKANAIIKYQKEVGFKNVEDLKNVSGIGDALYEKIKNYFNI